MRSMFREPMMVIRGLGMVAGDAVHPRLDVGWVGDHILS